MVNLSDNNHLRERGFILLTVSNHCVREIKAGGWSHPIHNHVEDSMNVYAPLTLSMYSDQDHSQEMTMTVSVVGGTSQLNQCNQDNPPTDMLRVPSPL